jgi:hypothetical protein
MTSISDSSGIIDLYSLEQFITINNLRQEASDPAWSLMNIIPDNKDEIEKIFGKCWFAIIVAIIQTVIKVRKFEPVRFGYQPTASSRFSWSDEAIYDISLKIIKKRFIGRSRTHLGILEKVGDTASIQDVIRLLLSQAHLWISSLGEKNINYNSVQTIKKVLLGEFGIDLPNTVDKNHPKFDQLVEKVVDILKPVPQYWPTTDGLNSKGLPSQQLPAVFRRTKEMIDACEKISALTPIISQDVLFEALERVLPDRLGTLAWLRNNPKKGSKSDINSNFRSGVVEGQKAGLNLFDAAKDLENQITAGEKLIVLAIAHQSAGEVLTPRKLLELTNAFDEDELKNSINKCSKVVENVCSKYKISDEDLHDYLFINNFPTAIEPI